MLNSEFALELNSLLPVYPTIGQVRSPLQDWLDSDLLVIEVPMLEFGKAEIHLALQKLTLCCRQEGPHLVLVVTPRAMTKSAYRRKTSGKQIRNSMERPVRRWNEWMYCPFQLEEICTCKLMQSETKQHMTYYVGSTFSAPMFQPGLVEAGTCDAPACSRPVVAHTPLGVQSGLCVIIRYAFRALIEHTGAQFVPRLCESGDDVDTGVSTSRCAAAPLPQRGINRLGVGASADTRLADSRIDPEAQKLAAASRSGLEAQKLPSQDSMEPELAYPTDSKEREKLKKQKL